MKSNLNRRRFLKSTLLAPAAAGLAFNFEEHALRAASTGAAVPAPALPARAAAMPRGKIGKLEISRLICGGNLTSGFAHSRDLIYVSALLKQYFTVEKIHATWRKCEENGINTAVLRVDDQVVRLITDYWYAEGGKLQWIAQCTLPQDDWKSAILKAVDTGAHAAFVHGGVADAYVQNRRIDDLAKAVELIRKNGLLAGIGAHMTAVPVALSNRGVDVDFWMKTFNEKKYWSAGPMPRLDSVFEETPEQTMAFMRTNVKPWIAYKVLGAGAIKPAEGFRYAFENGADFLCVGMFDFQVEQDAGIARQILGAPLKRARPWRGGAHTPTGA
ncbi:MAG: hypothetical protein Q7S40_29315 [Opitutaceae bacterium]|nr:hypothetical protein [Opitutaceae bacterium]